ncbi:cuticle protein 16.8-like [Ixodes scapularis]|uniref:cuticle protein 16.8-like n=1 Tax=Ixodes scapularis TaxID=6945 RepID=UPI001A9EA6A4|nr:cuticle protein 16.8-like [Ixodes scapularis]
MFSKVLLCCFVVCVASQHVEVEPPPQPYSFGFDSTNENGTRITQQETGDENNVKTGSYSYTDPYGIQRTVKYVADAEGFHVTIETNEPGTKSSNPADAQIVSASVEAPAPVEVKASPVVVKVAQQVPVVHAIQTPVSYTTAQRVAPIAVALSRAPLTYTLDKSKSS